MENTDPGFKFGGLKIPANGDKKLAIVAGIVTIAGGLILLVRARSNASSGSTTSTDSSSGIDPDTGVPYSAEQAAYEASTGDTGTTTGSTTDPNVTSLISSINGLESQIATANNTPPPTTVNLGFSTNNDLTNAFQASNSSTSSGTGGLSLFGIGLLGGSGSKSGSSTQSINEGINNSFVSTASITGGTPDEITQLENFLASEAGTSQQRADEANVASQQAYTYLNHAVSPALAAPRKTIDQGTVVHPS